MRKCALAALQQQWCMCMCPLNNKTMMCGCSLGHSGEDLCTHLVMMTMIWVMRSCAAVTALFIIYMYLVFGPWNGRLSANNWCEDSDSQGVGWCYAAISTLIESFNRRPSALSTCIIHLHHPHLPPTSWPHIHIDLQNMNWVLFSFSSWIRICPWR